MVEFPQREGDSKRERQMRKRKEKRESEENRGEEQENLDEMLSWRYLMVISVAHSSSGQRGERPPVERPMCTYHLPMTTPPNPDPRSIVASCHLHSPTSRIGLVVGCKPVV